MRLLKKRSDRTLDSHQQNDKSNGVLVLLGCGATRTQSMGG